MDTRRGLRGSAPASPSHGYGPGVVVPRLLGVALSLLIHIGAFKGTSLLADAPVDPTAALAALTAVLTVGAVAAADDAWGRRVWPVLLLWATFALGLPFVGAHEYAQTKALLLFSVILLITGSSALMARNRAFIEALVWSQVVAGVVMAMMLAGRSGAVGARLLLDGSNSIGAGRVVGAAVVVLGATAVGSRTRLAVHGGGVLALAFVLVGIGSRGPAFGAVIALGAVALLARAPATVRIRRGVLLVVGGVIALEVLRRSPGFLASRLAVSVGDVRTDDSIGVRAHLLHAARDLALQHPLGVGWGNFAPAARSDGAPAGIRYEYPHDVVVEVLVEAGWVAGAALLIALVASTNALRREPASAMQRAALGLALYFVGNALVSGDVTSNRAMWCFVGLGLGSWAWQRAQDRTRDDERASGGRRTRRSGRVSSRPGPLPRDRS